jgi:hypothetical protein
MAQHNKGCSKNTERPIAGLELMAEILFVRQGSETR